MVSIFAADIFLCVYWNAGCKSCSVRIRSNYISISSKCVIACRLPFGGVESIIGLITAGTLVPNLQMSTLVISGLILILTLVFGAVFCSFVCPLGTIQEWVGKLGKKIFKKQYNTFIPKKLHNVLKYLRYVVLVLTVILTFNAGRLIFADVDPYYAMYHFFHR